MAIELRSQAIRITVTSSHEAARKAIIDGAMQGAQNAWNAYAFGRIEGGRTVDSEDPLLLDFDVQDVTDPEAQCCVEAAITALKEQLPEPHQPASIA